MNKPLLGPCDTYELEPFEYPWAWDMSLECENNTWSPEEISVADDVQQWKGGALSTGEQHLFLAVMAQLTTFDIQRGDDAGEILLGVLQPAEIRHFLKRLIWEEALHCYEEGTEVLTSEGWVDFRDLTDDAVVAQVSMEGELSFTPHDGITKDPHNGVLYEFKNKAIHTSVTPNHRCVEIYDSPRYGHKNGKWNIVRAKDLTTCNRRWPVAASKAKGALNHLSPMDRLRIAFQADGHMRSTNRVSFHFVKQRKIDRLTEILEAAGLKYDLVVYPSAPHKTQVHIRTPLRLSKRLADWVQLDQVSDSWAQEFMDELVHWDGTITQSGRYRWSCHDADGENMGVVQAIAVIGGRHGRRSGPEMSLVDRSYVTPETAKLIRKPYEGFVYSVGVPTGIIVTRFKGKVLISGNTRSYRYIIENFSLDLEIYKRWETVPALRNRIEYGQDLSDRMDNPSDILLALIFWFQIFEGVWFTMSLLGPIQSLARRGLMRGAAEQFQYIMRDEFQHIRFGTALANEFIRQYPEAWNNTTRNSIRAMFFECLELEEEYMKYCLPEPILGYRAEDHILTARHYADRRLNAIGIESIYRAPNVMPWIDEMLLTRKEKNFFESRVTEYQTGGALKWD